MIYVCLGACRGTKGDWMISKGKVVASLVVDSLKSHKLFYFILFYFILIIILFPQQVLTYIVVVHIVK